MYSIYQIVQYSQSYAYISIVTLEYIDIKLFNLQLINLISRLLCIYNKNHQIITIIEYLTKQLIVCTILDVTTQIVINFIHKEIFLVYRILYKILLDNSLNLVTKAIETFLIMTKIKHKYIIPYYLQMNSKLKCFNRILRGILLKCLFGKLVIMQNKYLT